VTRWSTFYSKKYTAFKAAMEIAKSDIHCVPLEDNIYAKLDFFIQIPKSWSKKKKEAHRGKFCNNNADIDNYCKAILDSLNGKYYVDDRQIVMLRARMYWSTTPSIDCEFLPIQE
jgi:Holliday junction resolvase RusA-like endonuclease